MSNICEWALFCVVLSGRSNIIWNHFIHQTDSVTWTGISCGLHNRWVLQARWSVIVRAAALLAPPGAHRQVVPHKVHSAHPVPARPAPWPVVQDQVLRCLPVAGRGEVLHAACLQGEPLQVVWRLQRLCSAAPPARDILAVAAALTEHCRVLRGTTRYAD